MLTIHVKNNVARIASQINQHPLGWFMTHMLRGLYYDTCNHVAQIELDGARPWNAIDYID